MTLETTVRDDLVAAWPTLEPELHATTGRAHVGRWTFETPPLVLWPMISDTSQLNRALGIPAARYSEECGILKGETRYWRTSFQWEEPPWEWIQGRLLVCRKNFVHGPVRSVLAVLLLRPHGTGSELSLWYGWVPRGVFGRFIVPSLNRYIARGYERLIPRIRAWESGEGGWPLHRERNPERIPDAEPLVRELVEHGASAECAALWVRHVLREDPLLLDRLRPGHIAAQHGVSAAEMLDTALHATAVGQALARWDVLCPHCRGVRHALANLGSVEPTVSCDACKATFEPGAPQLELTFRVHPTVRAIQPRVYCAAEAARKPHILVQVVDTDHVPVPPETAPGTYVLRHADTDRCFEVDISADGVPRGPPEGSVQPGGFIQTAERGLWTLASTSPPAHQLGPAAVLSHPLYRQLMGADALHPSLALEVGDQTIVFTDVVSSTELYRRLGDQGAFTTIRAHFRVVFGLVQANGGVVVKTIGDAVMAAFSSAEDGLRAARAIATADLNGIAVRVSLHTGPCIAVNLDTGVDYFGSVVNEAAKLQAAARAGEVALSKETAHTLRVEGNAVTYKSGTQSHTAIVVQAD